MSNTFTYLMDAYFYQDWRAEYPDPKSNDKEVLIRFVNKEKLETLNYLIQELEYMIENNLTTTPFLSIT